MLLRELLLEASYNEFIDKLKRTYPDHAQYIKHEVIWAKTLLRRDDRVMWYLKILKQSLDSETAVDRITKNYLEHFFSNPENHELERVKRVQFTDPSKFNFPYILYDIEDYEEAIRSMVASEYLNGNDTVDSIYKQIMKKIKVYNDLSNDTETPPEEREIFYDESDNTFYGQDLKDLPKDIARYLKIIKAEYSKDYSSEDAAAFKSGDAKIVYQGPGVTVIECKSMAGSLAAISYGDGKDNRTWCTGRRDPKTNAFDGYNEKYPNGRSFVLHFPNESNNLDKIGIFGVVPGLDQSSIQGGVGGNFQDKGNVFLDDNRWEYLVKKYHLDQVPALKGIRGLGITREMYLAAVRKDSRALEWVPEKFLDREMYLAAVQRTGWVLKYVPEQLRDREMCLTAVKQTGWALEFVPEKLRDREICLAAVRQNSRAISYVPEKLRDREMLLTGTRRPS